MNVACGDPNGVTYMEFYNCMHGVGHAFAFAKPLFPIDPDQWSRRDAPCLPMKKLDYVELIRTSIQHCKSAPVPHVGRMCSYGVWHSVLETTFGKKMDDAHGVVQNNFHYPCSAVNDYSSICYNILFEFMGLGDWRYEGIRAHAKAQGLPNVCLGDPSLSEVNKLGCILGLSANFFVLFDKIVAARNIADLSTAPRKDRCVKGKGWGADEMDSFWLAIWPGPDSDYFDGDSYLPPAAHCDMLFSGGAIPATHKQHTLVAWCSSFVDTHSSLGVLSETDWQRWRACIVGSFEFATRWGFEDLDMTDSDRSRWCPQLLGAPLLSEEQRSEAYRLCINIATPKFGTPKDWAAFAEFSY
mmetsp:Transcript_25708/g.68701  ORF Transcript_25708/g.68701 Transcript_25708/m.68701 type:complete len:355 (-) Transcript_25708:477-1541(-)